MNPELRRDFPLLERTLDGQPVVYLDSAATSLKPWQVLHAEQEYATRFTANVHRGKHALSEEASAAFESARRRVARFINADPDCVVFVKNTTEALNLVAAGIRLAADDVVLLGNAEHHSNIAPWLRRARLHVCTGDPCAPVSPLTVEAQIARHRPKVFAVSHASNVTGVIQPVQALCQRARSFGAITVVDAAQSAPHVPIDVQALGCDFLAFSGHKMLGPTGLGVLYGRREALEALDSLAIGGGSVDRVTMTGYTLKKIPHRFEAGTPHISGALGLAAALDYIDAVGFEEIGRHEALLAKALARVLADIPGIRVIMAYEEPRLAIACIALRSTRVTSDHLARLLSDGHQIMVRSGYHCAHPLFDQLDLPHGAARASAYIYNTVEEIERFGAALGAIAARLVS